MRRCSLVLSILGLLALGAPDRPAQAQTPGSELVYSKLRQFVIPFTIGPGKDRLKELRLFVSTDQGKSWQYAAAAGPEQGRFQYISDRDGQLWFVVQTIDKDNRPYPATMDGILPHQRVIVDTQPPVVTLKQLPPRDGLVGVTWTIQDANYDPGAPDTFRLEFHPVGGIGWTPIVPRGLGNQVYWNPDTTSPIEVRRRATAPATRAAARSRSRPARITPVTSRAARWRRIPAPHRSRATRRSAGC